MKPKFQSLLLGLDPDHIDNLRKKTSRLIGNIHNLHFSGFNLGQIQDIIDKRKQNLTCALDISCIFRNIRRIISS